MKYESAELTKIAINIYLASSITTTNVLSKVCEKIDANWLDIIPALKLDKRIGKSIRTSWSWNFRRKYRERYFCD